METKDIEEESPAVWEIDTSTSGDHFIPHRTAIKVCKRENKIIVGFYLDQANIDFYRQKFPDGKRKPIGFEFDVHDNSKVFNRDNLKSVSRPPAGISYVDNYLSDDKHLYTLAIKDPSELVPNRWVLSSFTFSEHKEVSSAIFEVQVQLVGNIRTLRDEYPDRYAKYGTIVRTKFLGWFAVSGNSDGNNFFNIRSGKQTFWKDGFFQIGDRIVQQRGAEDRNLDFEPYSCDFGSDPYGSGSGGGLGGGGGGGSGGSIPTPPPTPPIGSNLEPISGKRADLRPDFDIYDASGNEISSNCNDCSGKVVDVGQNVRPKLWVQVNNNADAGKWKRKSSSDTIEGPIWWRIEGKTDWALLGSGEYTIGKLDKGDQISETHNFTIPSYPGDIIQWKACVDGDDEIYEEGESSSARKIKNPDQSATTNNCSRTERNYIRIPNYPPTGVLYEGDCNGFSGWAKDQNTSDPIRVHIYANGTFVGQPPANQYRSDVGNHGFSWETPEVFKDGSAKNLTFYAVDVPDRTETPIGSRTLVCFPPPSYDLTTTATWIDGTYTLHPGSRFTIRGVVQNLGNDLPNNATVTATLIHQGGTEYPMGSATVLANNLLRGWDADVSISAIAPSQDGRYQLRICATTNLQETNQGNNCLEVDGPFVPPIQTDSFDDEEEAAIWIILND
ncbi:MAG: hypothetical protein EOM19_01445 [Candidatus Moranbacteria bacterium]|nr:hypothetical protein [Candidatus Moranbacteria bacterium]